MSTESRLVAIVIAPECDPEGEVTIYRDQLSFYSDHSECDLCGSHGDIVLYLDCKKCKKTHRVTVSSW